MQSKQKVIATAVCVVQSLAILVAGKFVATWLGGALPAYQDWIEKGVLLIVLVPLMFFVIGPYMRKVTDSKKNEPEE